MNGNWYSNIDGRCVGKELNYLGWSDLEAFICYGLCALGFFTLVAISTIMYHHWDTPIIKAINRPLTLLQILINMAILITTLIQLGYPTHSKCVMYFIVKSPLVTGIVMCFVVKTQQVIKLFKTNRPAKKSRHRHRQIFAVFSIVSVQFIAVCTYAMFIPPTVSFLDGDSPSIIYVQCDYGTLSAIPVYLINNILIVACFILTFNARKLPQNFGESLYITYGVGCAYSCWIAFLPPMYMLNGRTKTFYEILLIYAYVFSLQSFYFFPKCYLILFSPEKNTVQALRKLTMRHMRRRSSRVNLAGTPARNGHRIRMRGFDNFGAVAVDELNEKDGEHIAVNTAMPSCDASGSNNGDGTVLLPTFKRPQRVKSVTFLEEVTSEQNEKQDDEVFLDIAEEVPTETCEPPNVTVVAPDGIQFHMPGDVEDRSTSQQRKIKPFIETATMRTGSLREPQMSSVGKLHQTRNRSNSQLCYVTDGTTRQLYHRSLNFMIDLGSFQPSEAKT